MVVNMVTQQTAWIVIIYVVNIRHVFIEMIKRNVKQSGIRSITSENVLCTDSLT